jgi:hypothetical protein
MRGSLDGPLARLERDLHAEGDEARTAERDPDPRARRVPA